MKHLLTFCLVAISLATYSQDTLSSPFKLDTTLVKYSWYGRTMPYAIYSNYGSINDRHTTNIEFGRSIGALDIGLCLGKTSIRSDSANFNAQKKYTYLEAKIAFDACQIGLFSNELIMGYGYVFNSPTPTIFELSSTIFAQLGKNWGLGVIAGYYDFTGINYTDTKNYVGLYARFGLLRNEGGNLMARRIHNHHRHIHH